MKWKGLGASKPYYVRFLMFLCIVLACTIIGLILWMLSLPLVFGIDILKNPTVLVQYNNPSVLNALQTWQTLQAFAVFIIPVWLFAYLVSSSPMVYLHLKPMANWKLLVLGAFSLLIASPLIDGLAFVNSKMVLPPALKVIEEWMKQSEAQAAEITQAFLAMHSIGDLLFKLVMIAALPALGEELIFRGVLQRLFAEWFKNQHIAIILTAIIFSAMHMQFYGFLPRFAMGVFLGYLLLFTNSLWVPVLAHMVNNGAAVIMAYFYPETINEEVSTAPNIILVCGSMVVVFVLTLLIHRFTNKKELA